MGRLELSQLNQLWLELGKVDTAQGDSDVVINKPFLHFPARTSVLHIWAWFEAQNNHFSVARQLYGKPIRKATQQ